MSANGPMREPTYFILAALRDQPRHGYAITKRAEELSGGRVLVAAGTLYAALVVIGRHGRATAGRVRTV